MAVRKFKGLKLSDTGIEAVQAVADRDGVNWSEAARRMLHYASVHMPARYGQPAIVKKID